MNRQTVLNDQQIREQVEPMFRHLEALYVKHAEAWAAIVTKKSTPNKGTAYDDYRSTLVRNLTAVQNEIIDYIRILGLPKAYDPRGQSQAIEGVKNSFMYWKEYLEGKEKLEYEDLIGMIIDQEMAKIVKDKMMDSFGRL